jgi:transcriptional regulator with XRE-family HTH domain
MDNLVDYAFIKLCLICQGKSSPDMNKSLSGNEIREIRESLKMKGNVFAGLLGITAVYLSELENDKKEASQPLINLILSKTTKGGDYTEILKRYIIHLEEENEKLKEDVLRLTTGKHDRRHSGGT